MRNVRISCRAVLAVLILTSALAGCNAPGLAGLTGGAAANADVFALANANGNTPPAVDHLAAAKEQFRERNFGNAERQFRLIVEKEAGNAEAWLGLAAAYDQLRRFDLADRAYAQVSKVAGPSAVLHNNIGYSYLLRGERARARAEFLKAQRLDPQNAFVKNNLGYL